MIWSGLRHAKMGMAFCDQQNGVLAADTGYAEILGRGLQEVIGLTMHDVTHPDDRACNDHLLALIRDTHEPFRIVKRYLAQDRVVWVENHVSWLGTGAEGRILLLSRKMEDAEILTANGQREPLDLGVASYIRDMSSGLAEMAHAGGLPTTASALRLIERLSFEEIEDTLGGLGPM